MQPNDAQFIVDRQLKAYNAKDIDKFMQCWSSSATYFEHPNTLLASGKNEIRERHIERFKDKHLHGTLHSRVQLKNTVVDHETVTRTFPSGIGHMQVIAIYEVDNALITNAMFIFGDVTYLDNDWRI